MCAEGGVLKGKKFPVAFLLSAMLNLWAHHDSGEAADGADQRPADLPVPSESHPTGGASHDLARGLVGRWTFDEGKGTIAHDSSGRGNHGTVMGGAKWAEGRIGGALEFDGQDDFVSIPNESRFDITGSITISAWIRVESFTKVWQSIVTKGDRAWRLHRASDTRSVGWACSDLSRQEVGELVNRHFRPLPRSVDGEVAQADDGQSALGIRATGDVFAGRRAASQAVLRRQEAHHIDIGAAQHIDGVHAGLQLAYYVGDDVHNVRVPLDHHQVVDVHQGHGLLAW